MLWGLDFLAAAARRSCNSGKADILEHEKGEGGITYQVEVVFVRLIPFSPKLSADQQTHVSFHPA